jgi:DNA-binding CsgD family transcriptional regulator
VSGVEGHPLLAAHAAGRRPALRLSETADPGALAHSDLYGDLLHGSGVEYEIAIGMRPGSGEAVVAGLGRTEKEFSERDRDLLDVVRPGIEEALQATQARGRLVRALAANPPPGTAVVLLNRYGEIELSSVDAERWLSEHFGAAEHPGWLPGPVADWLALPPRPPLVSEREGRRLTVRLLPGDPHALLLEEDVASFRTGTLRELGLNPREREVLEAASALEDESAIAWELFLSLHAVRERLERIEAKLDVATPGEAVERALREST